MAEATALARIPVLLVKERSEGRAAMLAALADEGFGARVASDEPSALELLGHGYRPAVVLVDLSLARLAPRQFAAALRAHLGMEDVPILSAEAECLGAPHDVQELAVLAASLVPTRWARDERRG